MSKPHSGLLFWLKMVNRASIHTISYIEFLFYFSFLVKKQIIVSASKAFLRAFIQRLICEITKTVL